MRFGLNAAFVVCITFIVLAAPRHTAAESPNPPEKNRVLQEVPEYRHWGNSELIPTITLRSARDSIVPDSVAEYNAATNKIARLNPRDIRQGIPVTGASSRRDAAERFLKTHHAEFGLSPDLAELRLERERPAGDFTRFTYEQLYQGLPVFGGSASVLARADSLVAVRVSLIPISGSRPLTVATDAAPAIKSLIEDVGRRYPSPGSDRVPPRALLGVLVRAGIPTCVWQIHYGTKDDTYRAYVDAETNEVLLVFSVRIYN